MAPPTAIEYDSGDVYYEDSRYTYDGYWAWGDEEESTDSWTDETILTTTWSDEEEPSSSWTDE